MPLAWLHKGDRIREIRDSRSARGLSAERVTFYREPTDEEFKAISPCLLPKGGYCTMPDGKRTLVAGVGPLVAMRWRDHKGVEHHHTLNKTPWVHGTGVEELDFLREPSEIDLLCLLPCLVSHGRYRFPGGEWVDVGVKCG